MSLLIRDLGCALILTVVVSACGPDRVSASETSASTEATSDASTEGPGESGSESGSESTGESGSETGVDDPDCALFLRLDQCCNQPFPAAPADVEAEADPCVVPWPVDWEALPADQIATCVEMQSEFCQLVDCDYAPPPSEIVEPDDDGVCRYVCEQEEYYIGYSNPGCGEPPPIAECLPTPLPCADEYCSCEGETIWGCGYVGEPFEHMGACE